jgi:predicted nuclease with TOPRIM domain
MAAKILVFLQENNITEVAQLGEKMSDLIGQTFVINDKLKPIERRMKTLAEHIENAKTYNQYKLIHKKYKELKPKYQADFYEANRTELTLYESAKRYLDANLNGHNMPLKSWKEEQTKLTAEKAQLLQRYYKLKEEVKEVETIKRSVENILPKKLKMQTHDLSL